MKEILEMIRIKAKSNRFLQKLDIGYEHISTLFGYIWLYEWPETYDEKNELTRIANETRKLTIWKRLSKAAHLARKRFGLFLDSAYHKLEARSDHEKITAVVATFLLLIAADLLLGLHQAWKHVYYLPIWFAAWFLPRSVAAAIATIASAWIIVSPYLRGDPYTAGLILGLGVALTFFHFGGLSISYLRDVFNRERHRARFDGLTDCLNATGLYEEGNKALAELAEDFRPFAVVYLDLDNFKQLNDTLGHLRADEALVEVGAALRHHTRDCDFVARMGGDEFVVWLNHIGPDLAFVVTQRIYEIVQKVADDGHWGFSASVGSVSFGEAPQSVHAALQAADDCMYKAKTSGKSKIVTEMFHEKLPMPEVEPLRSISIR